MPPNQVHDSDLAFQFITDECFVVQPLKIMASRLLKRGRGFADQVQVAWTGLPATLCTWESEAALRVRFPQALAWGQAAFQGGGPATTLVTRRHRKRDIRRALGRQLKTKTAQPTEHETSMQLT